MKTLLLGTVLASLVLLASCSKSSSNGDGNNSEAPETLDGASLVGELYVDYQEGDGFELEAKDLTFSGNVVSFNTATYPGTDTLVWENVTGTYTFEKTGINTGKLSVESNPVSYKLDMTFTNNQVQSYGIMIESNTRLEFPAKGTFNKR